MKFKGAQFFIGLLIFSSKVFAAETPYRAVSVADLKDGSLLLGPYLRIFEDKQGTARWEDVLAGKHDADFKPQNKAVPNFGSTRSVIWAVVDLRSGDPSGRPPRDEYLLELSHPLLDYVDVVVLDLKTKRILQSWQTGDLRPFDSRPIIHRNFLFPLTSGGGNEFRLVVKLVSESSMSIPLQIWHPQIFYERDSYELLFLGVFYGIMLVMIIYNTVISYAMKTLSGYLYVLYMVLITILQSTLDGFFYQFFSKLQYLNNLGITFWGNLNLIAAIFFTIQYLGLNRFTWRWRTPLYGFAFLAFLNFLIALFVGYRASVRIQFIIGSILPLFILTIAVLRARQGYAPARFYVLGYGTLMCMVTVFTLSRSGVLPNNSFIYHSMQIGAAIEAILLSFGLADRIRLIQKEKELAQAATIEQQRILNDAFARFVPTPFLQILGKKSIPEVLLGDYTEREMTILFADIRGFTTISEKLTPKATFKFINEYLHNTGPVIRKNGGFIDKYMGDGIMALFEKPDDAINAALRLQARNQRLNRSLQGRMVAAINVGIGIHTGHLMLGTIGEPQRMDGTVISDAVNLASRVESLTKQYGVDVLVTKETLAGMQLGTAERPWLRRFIDRIAAKGKSEPATLYEVFTTKERAAVKYTSEFLQVWVAAMKVYYGGDFGGCIPLLQDCARLRPDDAPVKVFLTRATDFLQNPPPADWNGVAVARSK